MKFLFTLAALGFAASQSEACHFFKGRSAASSCSQTQTQTMTQTQTLTVPQPMATVVPAPVPLIGVVAPQVGACVGGNCQQAAPARSGFLGFGFFRSRN